jgi:uncharacterized protein (DUF1800 family)
VGVGLCRLLRMVARPDLVHLLRRTEFAARPSRIAALLPLPLEAAVDDVLAVELNGVRDFPVLVYSPEEGKYWQQYETAVFWWVNQMVSAARPVHERMVMFWHGHFTSSLSSSGRVPMSAVQNRLFRTFALGDFHQLTQAVSVDPAMLLYLNNNVNRKGAPNENFARELLELFTIGPGGYTQDDVAAAARAWTGHNADWPSYAYRFVPERHDYGNKTFLGVTKAWDGPDVVSFLLRDNPATKTAAARFVSRKLWTFFAGTSPSAQLVDDLAAVMVASNMQIKPVLRALLLRPEFYTTAVKQGLVRTPLEFTVAALTHGSLPAERSGYSWAGGVLGHQLFEPPNVAGWKSNGYWLTTSGLSARAEMARRLTWPMRANGQFDSLNSLTSEAAVDEVAKVFGIEEMSATTRAALVAANRAERSARGTRSYWAPTNLLTLAMMTPEFNVA